MTDPVMVHLDERWRAAALAQAKAWNVEAGFDDLCLAGLHLLLVTCAGQDDFQLILGAARKYGAAQPAPEPVSQKGRRAQAGQ